MGQQRFAAAGGSDQQNIALLNFDLTRIKIGIKTFVVVVNRNGQYFLGSFLFNDVAIQLALDLLRNHNLFRILGIFFALLFNDLTAKLDAFIANINCRTGNQFSDL